MTDARAEKLANILTGVAAAGAAYYVLRDPTLRRRLGQIVRQAMTASGPWLVSEVRHAWAESGGASVSRRDSDHRPQRI
jgi:hypothetical protein